MGTMIITVDENLWINKLTSNIEDGWHIFLYNDAFTMISGYEDPSENEINDLKSALGSIITHNLKILPLLPETT